MDTSITESQIAKLFSVDSSDEDFKDEYPLTQTAELPVTQPFVEGEADLIPNADDVSFLVDGDLWFTQNVSLFYKSEDAKTPHETNISSFHGLPLQLKELYQKCRGIEELYEWQNECLQLPALQEGKNLIYSLPTSGGKTLVAEVLIMKEVICKKKNALFMMPYVSIIQEKVRSLSPFAVDLNFLVEEYAGSKGAIPPRKRRKKHVVYIATFEKAHSLVNSLIEAERLDEIGLVIVDELHMIGEGGGRGATLESLLSKLKFIGNAQIVGMSATLGNIDDFKAFLSAEAYCQDFRPVELKEYLKLGNKIFDCKSIRNGSKKPTRILNFNYPREMLKRDRDLLTGLVLETIPRHSCLIFCPTKKWCENVVVMLCSLLPKSMCLHKADAKKKLVEMLQDEGSGHICKILDQSIHFGLAYHHSGLTMDERSIIEEAYTSGTLCCLVCTSTLAAGVNLPARRVIIRAPYVGTEFLTRSRYKQMVGRAGRAGIDSFGESIMIVNTEDEQKALALLTETADVCQSSLSEDGSRGLEMLILSLISLEICLKEEDILKFFSETLFAIQSLKAGSDYKSMVTSALQNLTNMRFVKVEGTERSLQVSRIGKACVKACISPERAVTLYHDLRKASKTLNLANHLHLLYLVTPYDMMSNIYIQPDVCLKAFRSLRQEEREVSELIGIQESAIHFAAFGGFKKNSIQGPVHRFFLALMLYDLWKQEKVWDVASYFGQSRGTVQNLLSSSVSFAFTVARFCEELDEFWAFRDLMANFIQRFSYCVSMEIIPLMELPAVKKGRAKQLHSAGFKTLVHVAQAKPKDLLDKIEHLSRRVAIQIISAANMLVKEKAEALQEEAEEMILGLTSPEQ